MKMIKCFDLYKSNFDPLSNYLLPASQSLIMDNSISNSSDLDNSQVLGNVAGIGNINDNLLGSIFESNSIKSADRQLYTGQFEQHLNDTVIPLAQTALRAFEQSPDFASKMNLAFGAGFDHQQSKSKILIDNLAQGKLIPIEILPSGQIQAKGAFGENKTTYSDDRISISKSSKTMQSKLLEVQDWPLLVYKGAPIEAGSNRTENVTPRLRLA